MINFQNFLIEQTTEEKLKHLEHAEDHPINAGHAGFEHATNTLTQTHKLLRGEKSSVSVSTKYDGSPSIVFGVHPENKKFFVASKSAFNKDPKLNFTHSDIEKNHGHAPGLVSKLKQALTHLPKVAPSSGIHQGDFMYSKDDDDVKEDQHAYHFKPNTITYSSRKDSDHGEKIKRAKIGIVVHTKYTGNSIENLKAKYNPEIKDFSDHKDVHIISSSFNHKQVHYPPQAQKEFETHIANAQKIHDNLKNYDHLDGHLEHLKTYINSSVKNDEPTNVDSYHKHVHEKLTSEISKIKTPSLKLKKTQLANEKLNHIKQNSDKFAKTFELHNHLQKAKNVLVNTMANSKHEFHHSIKGRASKPEGFVAVLDNRPTKLVDRHEFSKENFLK